ncbi:hypothetical protein BDZ85DRAFT_255581 [Elsinoe ampelina]|uniref:DUF7730 domain-containing protein n=1 Tax=Elsinoe ampelina TaxID=302913 RepID=A0A6A6GRH8_9PEZI|nr:hypothetical protein BDZ85DRAFT_255581 [Elsinoe ampelina]
MVYGLNTFIILQSCVLDRLPTFLLPQRCNAIRTMRLRILQDHWSEDKAWDVRRACNCTISYSTWQDMWSVLTAMDGLRDICVWSYGYIATWPGDEDPGGGLSARMHPDFSDRIMDRAEIRLIWPYDAKPVRIEGFEYQGKDLHICDHFGLHMQQRYIKRHTITAGSAGFAVSDDG